MGLEITSYTVFENVSVVEVCTIVYSPSLPCPIDHPSMSDSQLMMVPQVCIVLTINKTNILCCLFAYSFYHGLWCCVFHLDV